MAIGPIPMDWPEQQVRLISQKVSPDATASEQILKGQAAMLEAAAASIPKGGSAFVERLYEITRYRTKFSIPGDQLKPPRAIPAELKDQLAGVAPGVEIKSAQDDRAGRVAAQEERAKTVPGRRSRAFGAGLATT